MQSLSVTEKCRLYILLPLKGFTLLENRLLRITIELKIEAVIGANKYCSLQNFAFYTLKDKLLG
jgi:hypothetical protein